ncbi:MAG: VOC family protein [Halanaerobiales bacterium]
MKPKLESAYICVQDMVRAVNFYQWFLERESRKLKESFYLFKIGDFRLFLFKKGSENENVRYGDNCLLSFEVENAPQLLEKMKNKGVEIVFPLQKILENYVFEFVDPEGNRIEVFSKI